MIHRLIAFSLICLSLSSCLKSDEVGCTFTDSNLVVPASEMADLQAYVTANRPAAILHPGGFYYEIFAPGTGTVTPTVCSNVTIRYAGYLTSGFKFDESTTNVQFDLGRLILGWQRGLKLIKAGGNMNLYLPPSLGYGANANGSIPANSITIFSIDLINVQ